MSARTRQSANGQVPPPDPGPPKLLHCRCGGGWLDNAEGRRAHDTVFGHHPEIRGPVKAKEEAPPRDP